MLNLAPSLELKNSNTLPYPSTKNEIMMSLSNENANVLDVMNGNRKFDVSLDGTLLSHTTNLNAFVLSPAVRICRVSTEREKISTSGCHFLLPGRQRSCCLRSLIIEFKVKKDFHPRNKRTLEIKGL